MKVTFILIVIGALYTVIKGLSKGLEDLKIRGQVETIQTTALLRSARILRRVLETCCHSNSNEKPSVNTAVKNSQGLNNNKKNILHVVMYSFLANLLHSFNIIYYFLCLSTWMIIIVILLWLIYFGFDIASDFIFLFMCSLHNHITVFLPISFTALYSVLFKVHCVFSLR